MFRQDLESAQSLSLQLIPALLHKTWTSLKFKSVLTCMSLLLTAGAAGTALEVSSQNPVRLSAAVPRS